MPDKSSALSSRNYLIYLSGSVVSLHGLWIYRVALGWFAWQLTHSEFWVGVVAFTQFAPAVVFGPIFGVLADRFDRRAASLLINATSIMNMLVLGLLTATGKADISVLVMLSLMQGTLDGAHMPVRMTIVPNLVDKEVLHNAIALNSIAFNVSRFVGPALAGLIIKWFGVATAFFVNGVTYIALVIAMILVTLKPAAEKSEQSGAVWDEMRAGARYVIQHTQIRALLIIVALASIFGRGALEMMPAFADSVFAGGSTALAILTSAIGAGAIVSGVALSRGTAWLNISVIRLAVICAGLLTVLLGLLDTFWIAVPVVVMLGVILSLCGVGSQILIQTLVDDDVRGRVSSFWGMIAFGGTSIGSLAVGISASIWGLQNAVVATGALCAIAALISALISKRRAVKVQ